MKIYAVSGLHLPGEKAKKPADNYAVCLKGYAKELVKNWEAAVEEGDAVLISDDTSLAMHYEDAQGYLDFIGKLKGAKIIICGDKDYWRKIMSKAGFSLPESVFALQNDSIRFEGAVICGTRGCTVKERQFETSEESLNLYRREIGNLVAALKSAAAKRREGDVLIAMIHYSPVDSVITDNIFASQFAKYNVTKAVYGHLREPHIQAPFHYVKKNIEYYQAGCGNADNILIRVM